MSTFKKILKAIGISLAFMVGYAVVQIMVTILFAVYFSFYSLKMDLSVYPGSNKAEQIMAYTQQNLMMNMALIVLIAGIISIGIMLLILLLLKKAKKWDMADFFRVPHKIGIAIPLGIICFLTGMAFNVGLVNIMELVPIPESWIEANNESVGAVLSGSLWIALAATSLIAPVAEELIFRGVSYTMLRDAIPLKRRFAVLIAGFAVSLAFGIYHGNILQGIYTFVFSILLLAVYERTGSIWSSILVHAGFNSSWLLELFAEKIFSQEKVLVNGLLFLGIGSVLLAGFFLLSSYGKKNAANADDGCADSGDHDDPGN